MIVCNGCKSSTQPTSTANASNSLTELTSSANPSNIGSPITFAVVVTGVSGPGSGRVLLEDGTIVIGVQTLDFAGKALLVDSNLTVGTHSIRAVYEGGGKYEGSTSNIIEEMIAPQPDIPVLETVLIPPLAGATTTDRITSLSYSGAFFVQPADSLEFRLRIPWPTQLQVLINGQQLQQIQVGAPPPQPDDAGYFTVAATPMPGWPDKIDPTAPGYNWFFVLADVKLPKQFRYQNDTTPIPGFTVTLRDLSLDGQTQAADVNLPMVAYPRPPFFGTGLGTPPSTVFLSGENSKDDTSFPFLARATGGIVAGWHTADPIPNFVSTVTLAGWLDQDAAQQRGNSNQAAASGRSEDWHFDLHLDPDFIQRNYPPISPPLTGLSAEPLASGVIPGQPEAQVNPGGCHQIPLTGGQGPDVSTFLMPGNGLLGVELNAWHTDGPRGSTLLPGWAVDQNATIGDPNSPDDSGKPVPLSQCPPLTDPKNGCAVYPNNAWAFNVLTGTSFLPFPSPPNDTKHGGQLKAGDYVIVTGTLWEDIAHLKSTPDPNRQCFEDAIACQGSWLEIHPVDVVRYVSPPPVQRKQPNVVPLCAYPGRGNFLSTAVSADSTPADVANWTLKFQEVADSRFTDPTTVREKQLQIDPCDPTKIDVNLEAGNPNGFGLYNSAIVAWWEKGATPGPQPNCAPKTFDFLELSVTTGDDDLGSASSAKMDILRPDQTPLQTILLKNPGPGWGNHTTNGQSVSLSTPQLASAFGNFVITLTEGDPNCSLSCDNWKIQNLSIRAFNTANGQIDGSKTDQLCLSNHGGGPDWQTLTKTSPTVTLAAFAGCPTEPPPQFSLGGGTYTCPQTLTLSDIDPSATIFFSTDGSAPTVQYSASAPITIGSSQIVTAIAKNGNATSPPSSGSYTCLAPPKCQPGFTACSGTCVNLNTDPNNCGSCGNSCFAGQRCTNGQCACPAGTSLCCGGDLGCRKPGTCPKQCP